MEKKILVAVTAKKLDTTISSFVAEHSSAIEKLGIDLKELTELLWEVIGEAVELRNRLS